MRHTGSDCTEALLMLEAWMHGVVLRFAQGICLIYFRVVLRRNEFAESVARHVVKTVSTRSTPSHYLYYARHHGFQ